MAHNGNYINLIDTTVVISKARLLSILHNSTTNIPIYIGNKAISSIMYDKHVVINCSNSLYISDRPINYHADLVNAKWIKSASCLISETTPNIINMKSGEIILQMNNTIIHLDNKNTLYSYKYDDKITNLQLISETEVAICSGKHMTIYDTNTRTSETENMNVQIKYLFGLPHGWGIVAIDGEVYTRN